MKGVGHLMSKIQQDSKEVALSGKEVALSGKEVALESSHQRGKGVGHRLPERRPSLGVCARDGS